MKTSCFYCNGIHNLILDLGFLNYLEIRKKRGLIKLFDIPKSGENAISGYFARIFKKFLNLEDSKVCFHSFRQTFITKINELAEAEEELNTNLKRIYGHSEGTMAGAKACKQVLDIVAQGKDVNEEYRKYKELASAIDQWGLYEYGKSNPNTYFVNVLIKN